MNGDLILIRGIPGAGKSTLAHALGNKLYNDSKLNALSPSVESVGVFEADQFFEFNGRYEYRIELINEAHAYCYGLAARHLWKVGTTIVSNTFTRPWEIQKYLELAQQLKRHTRVIHCLGQFKSIHGVSDEKLQVFKERMWSNEKLQRYFTELKFKNITYETYQPVDKVA